MEHSVELLRKAEKLALAYDAADGFFLAFSGGKDSQALYHMAQLAGVKFKAHFSPTSVDPPAVIRFIRKHYPDVEFLKLKESIYSIAVRKGLLPTRTVRWCCDELKEHTGAGKVTLIGIRKAESSRRNKRNEVEVSNRTFSGDMDGFEVWRREKLAPSVANPDAIESESVTGCIKGKDSLLISPIIYWSDKDVWEFLNDVVSVEHCELYDQGWHRIGCIGCPMSKHKQRIIDFEAFPHVKANWIKAIKAIRRGGQGRNSLALQPFDKCPTPDDKDREDVIAEYVFDWWLSDKPFEKWYAENFLQGKIVFPET
jgi:phosphoadenosine phosphosulfate reductase